MNMASTCSHCIFTIHIASESQDQIQLGGQNCTLWTWLGEEVDGEREEGRGMIVYISKVQLIAAASMITVESRY